MTSDLIQRRDELERIFRRATPILLEGYSATPGSDPQRTRLLGTQQKGSHRDLVTVYDKRVEAFLMEELNRAFPGEALVGEEGAAGNADSARALCERFDAFWVIDPIDGTTNYSRAYPFFCSTAAFVARQPGGVYEVLVGATWDPVRQEMFLAAKGSGAWLNRARLSVSAVREPQAALLTTGFANTRTKTGEKNFAIFQKLTTLTLGVRRDGSAALDLAYVAAGRTDSYWEWGLSPWDTCAGILLVTEAGGQVTHLDGSPAEVLSGEILSSNGFLHKWLQDTIRT